MSNKIKGIFFVLFLLNFSAFAQELKITTNIPESLNPGQTFDVEVTINKGSVSSFAKFQMDLPFGFTAASTETKNGNWTFEQQRVKIVWVSVPQDPTYVVKFKMTVPTNALNTCVITGKFFYLENNVKKEYEVPPVNLKISGGGSTTTVTTPTVTTPTTSTVETNTVVTTPTVTTNTVTTNTVVTTPTVTTNTVVTTPTVTTNTVVTTPTVTTNTVSTTSSTNGTTYRVQLGAFSAKPSKGKFPGVKDFWVYEDNGLYKATAGVFKTLDEAERYKAQLKGQGIDGAFVVAFQNGVRIKL